MGSTLPSESLFADADRRQATQQLAEEHQRCAICEHKLGKSPRILKDTSISETLNAHDPHDTKSTWMLCKTCFEAVQRQIDAGPVRSPLRVRIAVGLVASERTPAARRAYWDDLGDRMFEHVLPITIALAVLVHLATLVFIIFAR